MDCSSGASILRGADLFVAGIIGMDELGMILHIEAINFLIYNF